ncbi:hypothetical protein [Streptomyces sp. NBC_01334]|uniref:hypothetical protein n=1 Tax=Streptomyces sp. NBC_01334 TaxID=2903827 RepID=UPI002E0E9416|nr:hypothetical protein OG736_26585 [Streptomyces sp. NBC_01334]
MNRPGPALRTGLLGLAVVLTGYALLAAWAGWHAERYADARDRATARTVGVVVADGIGDDRDVRVRWTDDEGRSHLQRFAVHGTDRHAEGEDFPVAYDPATAEGFPADPDETAREDDLLAPVFLGTAVALPLVGIWLWRGLRFRLTARRRGRPMTARVRCGSRRPAIWPNRTTSWLWLTSPEGTDHWQRVMWHPALDCLPAGAPVTAHGSPGRPTVVALPDGTRLVPLGRLRHRRPPGMSFADQEAVRADLRDAFVLPADTVARPTGPWRRGAVTAASSTVLGVVAGFVLTDGSLVRTVTFALCAGTLATSVWALSAPQP